MQKLFIWNLSAIKKQVKINQDDAIHNNKLSLRIYKYHQYYYLLLPAFIYVLIFCYGPMYGLQIAFKNYKMSLGVVKSPWVGLRNFSDFFSSYYFWTLMKNTFVLSFSMLLFSFPVPILVALIINELNKRYKRLVQTVLYAPHFISTVVLVGMINIIFSPSMGIINTFLNNLGIASFYFLGSPNCFRPLYIGSGIWQNMGWNAIVYIAALASVNPSLHEAAEIDGATRLQRMIYINLHCIMPTIIILLIMEMGRVATISYEKVYLMQNELNLSVSEVIPTYVYKRGIVNNNYSFATAVGLFNNLINVTMLLMANLISKKFSETSLF
ncbi:MAG: ABC transporter permease subunit [Clostridiaceae bacterium]|nr:ABC transporter permease subunit [Clostridiaceae bacterium]